MPTERVHRRHLGSLIPPHLRVQKGQWVPGPTPRDEATGSERSGVTARRFVGRERELSELTAGLDEAASGRGSLFLLSGEPGIGKTRLAKEVADLAARREARVLWGHAWDGGGQPAYWPWVQILRSYARSEDPAVVWRASSTAARTTSASWCPSCGVSPRVARRAGCAAASIPTAPASISSTRSPSFCAMEPRAARWSSSSTISMRPICPRSCCSASWRPSCTRCGSLAIGTYREVEARRAPEVASLLADLARASRRIAIGGLAERDIALLIEESAGIAPSPELVSAVHRVTEGNPFFADEIVRFLAAEGRLQSPERSARGSGCPTGSAMRSGAVSLRSP